MGTGSSIGVSGDFTFQLNPGKDPSCSGTSNGLSSATNPNGAFTCANMELTPGTPDGTVATISFGTTSSGASFSGTVNYYTGLVSGTWRSTGTAQGSFIGMRE